MEPECSRRLDVKKRYGLYRRFISWFTPVFLALSFIVLWFSRSETDTSFIVGYFICSGTACGLAWMATAHISRRRGIQTWIVADGRVMYHSPSWLLGKSFDVALGEITDVRISATEGALLELFDGSHVEFLLNDSESLDFYEFLREHVKQRRRRRG